jgi:hypothetical protein
LPPSKQKELLKGDKDPFTQDEILERMGEDRAAFRGYYRFLSAHTHTGPISFYRMAEHGRGTGIENRIDKAWTASALSIAGKFLKRASEDMLRIYPDAEHAGDTKAVPKAARRRHQR